MASNADYVKTSFDSVAENYDEIAFFKISAAYISELVNSICTTQPSLHCQLLDVACGTGNVALKLAQSLPAADVLGIDLSSSMLHKAQTNAQAMQLNNVVFQTADITQYQPTQQFDVITCAYAMFFLPDADQTLAKLSTWLKPEGKLIFSSFQATAFQPVSNLLLSLLRKYQSPSALAFNENNWSNLLHSKDIEKLCSLAKVNLLNIQQACIGYPLTVNEWWRLFNNTGYKGMLMELSRKDYQALELEFFQSCRETSVYQASSDSIELNADSFFVIVN